MNPGRLVLSEDTLGDVVELVVLRKKTEIHFCVVFALETVWDGSDANMEKIHKYCQFPKFD